MIEFCNKKRMALAIVFLIGMSVVVLFIESSISVKHGLKDINKTAGNSSVECRASDQTLIKITDPCGPCSAAEQKALPPCRETGFRERVQCGFSNGSVKDIYRSCPKLDWLEEQHFYVFEAIAAISGLTGYGMVMLRQKRLDKKLLEKVHKQIASGV